MKEDKDIKEDENDGYETVFKKRKHMSPEMRKMKRDRKFTPEKAGNLIFRKLKLREDPKESEN